MKLRDLIACALFTALICVISPYGLTVGLIPITLATFAVYLSAAVLGWKWGTAAVLVYLALGAAGMPVFSNFGAGFAKIAGPTGGYLIGYLPCALIAGLFADKYGKLWAYGAGMLAGTAVLYLLGTAWYSLVSAVPFGKALAVCVLPFLPGDGIKMALASLAAVKLRPLCKKLTDKAKV